MWCEFYCSGVRCFLCPSTKVWGKKTLVSTNIDQLTCSTGWMDWVDDNMQKLYLFICPCMIKVLFIEVYILGNGKLVGFFWLCFCFQFKKNNIELSLCHSHFSHRDPECRTSGYRKWMKGWMHFYLSTLSWVSSSTAFGAKVSHKVALNVLINCHMKEHLTTYLQIATSIHVKRPKCYFIMSDSYIKYDDC